MTNQTSVTPERIMQMAWGYAAPLALESAVRHRVFDVLDAGPKAIQQVHESTGASIRGLTAIMNFLVGINLLARDNEGLFALTQESSAFLVSSKPAFQGGIIRHCSEHLIPKWLNLNEIVATGKPVRAVNKENDGAEFFQAFVSDIFPMSYPAAQTLAQHLSAHGNGRPSRVLDLAAGSGVWGIALAQNSDQVRVTAVDWPEVLSVTRKTVAQFNLSDRFSYIAGDLLDVDFGRDYTLATLGHILHSEGEERSRELLAKTFQALNSGGTIAIAEFLVNADRKGPVNGLLFAINMLVNTEKGNTFSFEEISEWLAEAGFVDVRSLDSPGPSPLILATKP